MRQKGEILEAEVEALNHDGQGVARIDGKVYFIDHALAGEQVRFTRGKRRRSFETGHSVEILRASPDRVEPRCEYFGTCGGCALQHLSPGAQIRAKQQQLADNLERIAKVVPERMDDPIVRSSWGYRRKARLGVRNVEKKGGILVGFREKHKSFITPLSHCPVLHPRISSLLPELKSLLEKISCNHRIPQIEVAIGDNAASLVFRHLEELTRGDLAYLTSFGEQTGMQVYLQPKGPETIHPLFPREPAPLYYVLPVEDIKIFFEPTDFVQVNAELNAALVQAAIERLRPSSDETVLDLFCGLGNFTLPIARRAGRVFGLEGERGLVARGAANAKSNHISNAEFSTADLYEEALEGAWTRRGYDKVLLDPPRSGAVEVVKIMDRLGPDRIVYVSCNPATLARDAGLLVHKMGYQLKTAGVVDMFPHTTHVESIAAFER